MKISVIGGGPAGLYFASFMKRRHPDCDITVYERNARDATFGFGVVFSDSALRFLAADDEPTYDLLRSHMEHWANIGITRNDVETPVAGNGFSGIGRLQLLQLLTAQAEALGVPIRFGTDVTALDDVADADVVVAANGLSSWIRDEHSEAFGAEVAWHPNKFIWCGTDKAFDHLTLTFKETPAGVFCAHHYRYNPTMSTFLVEVSPDTWATAGFDTMPVPDAMRYCERVFARELSGHRLISNNSYWRNFPVVSNRHWSSGNIVLIGDALRTVHFSIGSGTRLAMEDSVALVKSLERCPGDVPAALADFQTTRQPPMELIWNAANTSLGWYEEMDKWVSAQTPVELAYNYMRRTGRVSHADIAKLDPRLASAFAQAHPEH